ncbi:CCR4-NOT transcription complex subunit 1 [Forsythia ovata]|uniref:CCR4-NOT transcription complex subunit 1 n=1 Tax=Forsythia ovata TaxID=205694 RepID=A0ABD1S1H9_9LAMI
MDAPFYQFVSEQAIGLSGVNGKDYASTELSDLDPAGFQDQVSVLFAEWYQICELPGTNDAACARYILHLLQRGLLKEDDMSDRFFSRLMNKETGEEAETKDGKIESLKSQAKSIHTARKVSPYFHSVKQEEDSVVVGLLDGTTKSKVELLMSKTIVAVKCVISTTEKWDEAYKRRTPVQTENFKRYDLLHDQLYGTNYNFKKQIYLTNPNLRLTSFLKNNSTK